MSCNRPIIIVAANYAIDYDGSNSAALAEHIADFTITAETSTELTFTSGGRSFVLPRGGYAAYASGAVFEVFATAEDLQHSWAKVSAAGHVHDLKWTTGPGKPAETYPVA